ncbi:MAG: hypothetical protein GX102_00820 [Porphyromonadaceae bacterium]|nr:hypothetical protein [Porphyromonadaceae bacterium]
MQKTDAENWWKQKRKTYNIGLIIAGFLAFTLYSIVGSHFIPYEEGFEITIFTLFFQGIGYLIMMAIANLCYNLGYFADENFNTSNSPKFRKNLFNFGFWFSVILPFSVPTWIVIRYLITN